MSVTPGLDGQGWHGRPTEAWKQSLSIAHKARTTRAEAQDAISTSRNMRERFTPVLGSHGRIGVSLPGIAARY
jgi:hypothetical protein